KPSHLVVFDAHLDLRKEYLGEKLSHATYLRWICEYFDGLNITCVGSRGFCTEEIEYAAKKRISIISSVLLLKSFNDAYKRLSDILATADRVYISIDMDVLDPAFVNEVGNPEPEGLTPTSLFDLFELFKGKKVMGFDVMELSPTSFWNPSHYLAAKIVYELMAAVTDDPEVMISNLNI
ncbi:agmatinase, partial [Candidatus Geothermarchaeota archaeon]